MSQSTSSNPAKACFVILEGEKADTTFTVQYNPKEFKVDKKVSWKEVDEQGKDPSPLEFQKGSPRTISMELMFDTTNEETETDVFEYWVEKLLVMTNADSTPQTGEATDQGKERPTTVRFEWGSFELTGVVESVTTSYTLFSASGTPMRAKCQVKMKEWDPEPFEYSNSSGGGWAGNEIRLVETVAGQLPADLAAQNNTTTQQICKDNNIDDPTEPFAGGEEVVVRPGYQGGAGGPGGGGAGPGGLPTGAEDDSYGLNDFIEDLGEAYDQAKDGDYEGAAGTAGEAFGSASDENFWL
jgi:hypothetical protein